MQFNSGIFNTRQLPNTLHFLKDHVPAVLKTKCFNPQNLSFKKEVTNTHLAHLFEHILLTHLCEEEIKSGSKCAKYGGVTQWNWKIYPKGSFKVIVNSKVRKKVLELALLRTIAITELLMKSHDPLLSGGSESIRQQPPVRPLSDTTIRLPARIISTLV